MLLAWLGSGNYPTDVAGHFWAFLYGLLLATVVALLRVHANLSQLTQRLLLTGTWLLIILSWLAATKTRL